MALPEIRGVGAITSGTGTITPGYATGTEAGDLGIIFAESGGAAGSGEATPELLIDGWDVLYSNKNGNTRLTVLTRILTTATDARTTNDTGDHQMARMIVIKKGTFDPDAPVVVLGNGTQASTTSVSISGGTNPRVESLVFAASAGSLPDATGTEQFSSWANASLSSLTERIDNTVTAGDGGALAVASGTIAAKGTVNATTVTAANTAPRVNVTIAVLRKPSEAETEPVRRLSRTGEHEVALGAVSMTGNYTQAGLIRLDFNTDWQLLWGVWSGGDLLAAMSKPDKFFSMEGPGAGSAAGFTAARDRWLLFIVDKEAGNNAPRFHLYDFSMKRWIHSNGVSGFVPDLGAASFTQIMGGAGEGLEGDIAALAFWTERLSDAQCEELAAKTYLSEWSKVGTPKALWLFNQAVVTTKVEDRIGSADETERVGTSVAQVVMPIPYEEDVPQVVQIGRVVDAQTARALTRVKRRSIGRASETDAARTVTRIKTRLLGRANETNASRALTRSKRLGVNRVVETDLARAVAAVRSRVVGRATETSVSRALGRAKSKALSRVTESSASRALATAKKAAIGRATETGVARSLIKAKAKLIGRATATGSARVLVRAKSRQIGRAITSALARTLIVRTPFKVRERPELDGIVLGDEEVTGGVAVERLTGGEVVEPTRKGVAAEHSRGGAELHGLRAGVALGESLTGGEDDGRLTGGVEQ